MLFWQEIKADPEKRQNAGWNEFMYALTICGIISAKSIGKSKLSLTKADFSEYLYLLIRIIAVIHFFS